MKATFSQSRSSVSETVGVIFWLCVWGMEADTRTGPLRNPLKEPAVRVPPVRDELWHIRVCVCVCVVADVAQASNWSLWWEALCFSISFPCYLLCATARFDCLHSVYIKLWMNSGNTRNTVCPLLIKSTDYDTYILYILYIYIYIYIWYI